MNASLLVQRALEIATTLHDGQYRKNSNTPYIVHPMTVMLFVSDYTHNEEVLAAALLHDTVEDTDYTFEQLENDFGKRVRNFVADVSEDSSLPWRERKERYLEHIRSDTPRESVLIAAADKLHNMHSILTQIEHSNKDMWNAFEAKKGDYMWYWKNVVDIAEQRAPEDLARRVSRVYNLLEERLTSE